MDIDFIGLSIPRLNRSSFVVSIVGSLLVITILSIPLILVTEWIASMSEGVVTEQMANLVTTPLVVGWFIYFFYNITRRLRDIDRGLSFLLWAFLPLGQLYVLGMLFLAEGDQEKNGYGKPLGGTYLFDYKVR